MFSVETATHCCCTHSSVTYCSVWHSDPRSLAGCLFVCGDVLVSVQSFRIFLFSLFINNMQVQMLLWSLKLTVMCITSTVAQSCLFPPCIDWQADSFFLCCDLPSLLSSLSSALREPTVLTLFRRLVDAWLQCCVVFLFLPRSIEEKKFEKVAFNFPRMLTIIYVCTPSFSTILVASLLFLIISHFYVATSNICSQSEEFHCFILWSEILYMS